jgi:hypothetical protein
MAKTPAVVSTAVAPVSAAPAAIAIAPTATPGPVAMPTETQSAPILPPSLPGKRPVNELVTTTGVTYRNVEVQRVVSDGIFISYAPARGGWAMTKVPFKELPPEIRLYYEK